MNILINLASVLLGRALQELLEREPEGYLVRSVSDVSRFTDFKPDFVVVDNCTVRSVAPLVGRGVKIIFFDSCLNDQEITALILNCKIDCILSTTSDMTHFKKALEVVAAGQIWIDNSKIKAIVQQGELTKNMSQEESLSKKEREIIIMVSQGFTNRVIATNLHISEQTVKTHLSRIFRKTHVSRRSQLVPLAMRLRVAGQTLI
jgi:DNA-binding NarL/FixJ family response regulator